jgi:membrane-bound serine protease (ClpP class)
MTAIIALAIVGILLLLAELVLPGGIVGIGGAICLLASVTLTFINYGPMAGAVALVAVLILGVIMTWLWAKNFHRLPFTRRLVLNKAIDDSSEEKWLESLIGKCGISLTRISPSGHADIEGQKVDVMTESGSIEKGKGVKVIETRGPSIIVEENSSADNFSALQ